MTNTLINTPADVVTFSTGASFARQFLIQSISDVETALFFGKVYGLSHTDVAEVLSLVAPHSEVVQAFTAQAGEHSTTLQDFLVEECWDEDANDWVFRPDWSEGTKVAPTPVDSEVLVPLWKQRELVVAESVQKVAEKLRDTLGLLPGRSGQMVFATLAKVNAKRPTIGDYRAQIKHAPVPETLVILDVSGSMTEATIKTIVDDVVGLAYEANAALAIVSETCTYWDAGAYSTAAVLENAEYFGTHYEQLAGLFTDRHWDVVITVADYDSSIDAARVLARCSGTIGSVFDVSLVGRSTFLAECLAPLADEVTPILVSSTAVMSY